MEQSGTIMKELIKEQWINIWHAKMQNIVPINVSEGTK